MDVNVASSNPPGGSAQSSPFFRYAFIEGRAADPGLPTARENNRKNGDANRDGAKQNLTRCMVGQVNSKAQPMQKAPCGCTAKNVCRCSDGGTSPPSKTIDTPL